MKQSALHSQRNQAGAWSREGDDFLLSETRGIFISIMTTNHVILT